MWEIQKNVKLNGLHGVIQAGETWTSSRWSLIKMSAWVSTFGEGIMNVNGWG